MDSQILKSRIHQVFVQKFEIPEEELLPEKRIFEDLELDSLDVVDLVAGLQHIFGIPLRDNKELLQVRTIQDIYDFLEKIIQEHPEIEQKIAKEP